jgi:LysM repeat protein
MAHVIADPSIGPTASRVGRDYSARMRVPLRMILAGLLAIVPGGCVTVLPEPTPLPPPSSVASPTSLPDPTARTYTVRLNDTLNRIAQRFGLTVGQLLTANPEITDPNLLRVGQVIVIPPPNAPDSGAASGGLPDARDDLVDPDTDEPIIGVGYADVAGLGARVDRGAVRVELALANRPPPRIDPAVETLVYTVVIDIDDDDQPDYRLTYGTAEDEGGALVGSLEDRATGVIRAGTDFPGEVETRPGTLTWTVDADELGGGNRFRFAARVEREFWPGGRADPEVEATVDYAPDQQWPRPNPRWVELGAPLARP